MLDLISRTDFSGLILSNSLASSQTKIGSEKRDFISFSNLGFPTESAHEIHTLSCIFSRLTRPDPGSNFDPPLDEVPSQKADPPEGVEGQQKTEHAQVVLGSHPDRTLPKDGRTTKGDSRRTRGPSR